MPPVSARIQKWGNSLAVRIPKGLAARANLEAGAAVAITSGRGGDLTIKLAKRRKPLLKDLVAGMNKRNRSPGVDLGPAVGKELL